MAAPTYTVYTLSDPSTGAVRYIGITRARLRSRLSGHLSFRDFDKSHRANWLRSLVSLGLRPSIAAIEETSDPSRERFWIAEYRSRGARLVNSSEGGESFLGYIPPASVRLAVSNAKRGRPISQSHKDALLKAITGRRISEKQRVALSLGRGPQSPESRLKVSLAMSGRSNWSSGLAKSPDQRAKISAALLGHKQSDETKTKKSIAMKGRAPSNKGVPWSQSRRDACERSNARA